MCSHGLADTVESPGSLEDEALITDRRDNVTMMGDQYLLSSKEDQKMKQDEKLSDNQSSIDITFPPKSQDEKPSNNQSSIDITFPPKSQDEKPSNNQSSIDITFPPKLFTETDGESVNATISPFLGNDSDALETDNKTSEMPLMASDEAKSEKKSTSVLKLKLPRLLDGCQFKNHTYAIGEKFYDGCEASCLCEGVGKISCLPRCSLQDTSGHTCKEVPDPNDPCCYIVECTPLGIHPIDVKALPIEIKSVEPRNATSARLSFSMMSHGDSPLEVKVQLWIAPVPESNDGALNWTKRIYEIRDMLITEPFTFDINVSSLRPNTEYYLKLMKVPVDGLTQQDSDDVLFSNTVTVKTYPLEVKKTFQGCFHGNHSYEIGEVFFDGCEYKCICRKGGLFECQDRCEVYIDTIGYENCKWGPAADDSCCTVPYCNEPSYTQGPVVPPNSTLAPPSVTICKGTRGESHTVGEVWVEENNCKKKICNCEIHKNGSTIVKCKEGCPSISKKALQSSPNCPFPILITPDDNPCLCPYVFCTNSFNPLQLPGMGCTFKGKHYKVGEEFHDECRSLCHCGPDLEVNCALIECPHHFPPHVTECLEWHIDPNFQPIPPNCCPPPKCKNDGSCRFNGIKINNFQPIPNELLDCGTRCACVNGNVTCENRCRPLGNIPPPNLPCPPALAYKGHIPGDTCCMHWMCREPHPSGRTLENVSIVALNGTTVRVRFTLPSLLVGLVGHAELHYTTNPTIPRPAWLVQKFARPQRLFDTSNIEYYMTKLQPGSTYFFQIRVIMETLRGGPESEVYKLTLPEIFIPPSTTTQSTTTTREEKMKLALLGTEQSVETTTLPSVLVLDTNMKVDSIKTNSVNVTWRMFEPQEKKLIDGLLLKYKLKDETSSEWKRTPIIHREVTSYKISDLQPSTSYMIEMEFKNLPDIPTHVMSDTPMEVKTLPQVTEEHTFVVALHVDKVGPYSTELSLSGAPSPLEKYVHVVRLVYRNQSDSSQHYLFKIPEEHLTLEKLRPASRYTIWAEIFLINGKTITSNTLDVTTKVEPLLLSSSDNSSEQVIVNDPEALQENQSSTNTYSKAYYVALIIVAIIAGVTGLGFIILLILLMKKQSSAKAPISKAPSKTDYDNPTFKSYDAEGLEQKSGNGQA
ncbi:putative epidermal cell surface receptor isoform X2 [Limulus polyphemus]|uniref:Epidermal cell surface receptor isoform X2 n=1 Tax=Limulus polyphemus TaxID=6850 RepID=A0ABM1SPB5_LIMPO|nr:putative epidermal cell surface receptor isoform X2 [Limulus polyphemus]